MTKLSKFLQSNKILVKWTIGYVLFWAVVLRFVFDFNMFSIKQWTRFFNETMHGFWGLVFVTAIYGSALIYIASAMMIYRKNKPVMEITVPDKVKTIASNITKIFSDSSKTTTTDKSNTSANTTTTVSETNDGYPNGLPPELYIPYMRAKNHITKPDAVSDFNKVAPENQPVENQNTESENESFPIPTDFDISDTLSDTEQNGDHIPQFTEINFDTPIQQTKPDESKNGVIKYCEQNKLEYETLDDFIMMKKYLIYDHNDEDFWIMDDDVWFASGKQKKSPVNKLIDLAEENSLSPVIYLESKNVLDIEHIMSKFEKMGIRVVLELSQLS